MISGPFFGSRDYFSGFAVVVVNHNHAHYFGGVEVKFRNMQNDTLIDDLGNKRSSSQRGQIVEFGHHRLVLKLLNY